MLTLQQNPTLVFSIKYHWKCTSQLPTSPSEGEQFDQQTGFSSVVAPTYPGQDFHFHVLSQIFLNTYCIQILTF